MDSAIADLTAGVDRLTLSPTLTEYHQGCEALASAFQRITQQQRAIDTLKSCVAQEPPFLATGYFNAFPWQRTQLRLADEYRKANQFDAARAIENDLRRLLAVADTGHPLTMRLESRNGTPQTP